MCPINLRGKSLERQIGMSLVAALGRPQNVTLGCLRDGQIGSLGDVSGMLEWTSSVLAQNQYLPAGKVIHKTI